MCESFPIVSLKVKRHGFGICALMTFRFDVCVFQKKQVFFMLNDF